eukprot:54594-Eustigmatos_ZCMA.PRE.1
MRRAVALVARRLCLRAHAACTLCALGFSTYFFPWRARGTLCRCAPAAASHVDEQPTQGPPRPRSRRNPGRARAPCAEPQPTFVAGAAPVRLRGIVRIKRASRCVSR